MLKEPQLLSLFAALPSCQTPIYAELLHLLLHLMSLLIIKPAGDGSKREFDGKKANHSCTNMVNIGDAESACCVLT